MKVINGVITFNRDDAPVLVDTLMFAHRAFLESVTDPTNVKLAMDNPDHKRRMLNSIERMFTLDDMLDGICEQGGWPKNFKVAPIDVILKRSSLPKSPQAFFDMLVAINQRKEKEAAEKKGVDQHVVAVR